MQNYFNHIGIVNGGNYESTEQTQQSVLATLNQLGVEVFHNPAPKKNTVLTESFDWSHLNGIEHKLDLIIVIGGDGSMLKAIGHFINFQIPILGINHGVLGFLTDIEPAKINKILIDIVQKGKFVKDNRFILQAQIQEKKLVGINELIIKHKNHKLIEFSVFIDDQFVFKERADGLIVSTATGSTAYALSSGGAIISPNLEVFSLVSICPHNLTNRPIVISNDSIIDLVINEQFREKENITFSCDLKDVTLLGYPYKIRVSKYPQTYQLIHPKKYNFFKNCRQKLNWIT